ncbi:MAG: protease modulator HflK, partial [Pseudomonadota bacterium]
MAGNNGGPWGGGGGNSDDDRPRGGNRGNNGGGPRGPGGEGPQIPEIDELVKKGQERLRVLMGGKGGGGGTGGNGGGGGGPALTRGTIGLGILGAIVAWGLASFYTVAPEEQSVELFLGEYYATGNSGLNFAPWPLVTAEVLPVTREQTEDIGSRVDSGLMLTTDENIIDIDFQVVWNINDPAKYLFNLAEARETIRAVSESAMREVIARNELAPILNRDRQVIADEAQQLIQGTLDAYDSGVNIVRLN